MFRTPFRPFVFLLIVDAIAAIPLLAQENSGWRFNHERGQTPIPVKNWAVPLYFHPSEEESALMKRTREESQTAAGGNTSSSSTSDPSVPLDFVAMTPCRVMDTRTGQGQTGPFGPPTPTAGSTRTVPIPTHPTCSVPATALAYSLNVTVVPQGVLHYVTLWPTGQSQPNVSTLNDETGVIIANAAIVPAGTSGSINVYVTNTADVILDINGYFVPHNGKVVAYGNFATDGTMNVGSSNLSCSWSVSNMAYTCTITGVTYTNTGFITLVTATEAYLVPSVGVISGSLQIGFVNMSNTLTQPPNGFSVTVLD